MQPIKSLIDYRKVRAARVAWLFIRVQRIVSFICGISVVRYRRQLLNSLMSCGNTSCEWKNPKAT